MRAAQSSILSLVSWLSDSTAYSIAGGPHVTCKGPTLKLTVLLICLQDLLERLQPNIKRCESFDEAVQLAISALQNVISGDFRPAEIEVGIVQNDATRAFRMLADSEVEEHLTAIAERD